MKLPSLVSDTALSVAAGYAGTEVMEPVSMKLYELERPADRAREDAVRPGPPYQLAAKKAAALLRIELDDEQLSKASMAAHYGLALGWAPLYAVLRRRTGLKPLAAGLATGAAMSVVADELMTPALGFSAPNREYPAVTHVRGFVAHLAFGLGVATVFELGWSLLRRGR